MRGKVHAVRREEAHITRRSRLKPLRNMIKNVVKRAMLIEWVAGALSRAAEQPGQLQPDTIPRSIMIAIPEDQLTL